MKKLLAITLALMALSTSAFAMAKGGEPYRKCQAKIWSKPFICGGEALYKKIANGTATQQEKDAYQVCNLAESQKCCDSKKPGSVWIPEQASCVNI